MNDITPTDDITNEYEIASADIDEFIEGSWNEFLTDAQRLIAIDSSRDSEHATASAPFGLGPRAALDEVLSIARRMGFEVNDGDGYAGFAEYRSVARSQGVDEVPQQLGVIGHVDVVPAGVGWTFDPFTLTQKEGILIGRGTSDDKLPLLCALYACKFWMDRAVSLRHDVRFIFGTNEETGMQDVAYYLQHHKAPDFLFTPDADFPLCYGEKGLFGVTLSFDMPEEESCVVFCEGGVAPNAVPALAHAVLRVDPEQIPEQVRASYEFADRISLEPCDEGTRVSATGISGHASLPEGTVNAIGVLTGFLARLEVCSERERACFAVVEQLAHSYDGSSFDFAASDEDFGALTSVVGTLRKKQETYSVTVDIRFPTSVTGNALEEVFATIAQHLQALYKVTRNQEPFVIDPQSDCVQALMRAYTQSTGREVRPFTMGGATYAREFPHAVSFGPLDHEMISAPDWVGEMHGADEGISEEAIKHAIRIYVRAFGQLAQVDDLSK